MNILLNVITIAYVATRLGVFSFHKRAYLQFGGEAWVKDRMSLNCEFEYKSNNIYIASHSYIYIYAHICIAHVFSQNYSF